MLFRNNSTSDLEVKITAFLFFFEMRRFLKILYVPSRLLLFSYDISLAT